MPLSSVPLELELAVTILEDETRRAIFETLWRESWPATADEYGITFRELRESVGIENPSRLSYHLERMKAPGKPGTESDDHEQWPEKTPVYGSTRSQLVVRDEDRYYVDQHLGQRIVQLWALSQPEHEPVEPTAVPWDCPYCNRQLLVTYRHHRLDLWCEEHGDLFVRSPLSGDVRGHSPTELVHLAALNWARDRMQLLEGVCPACSGPVTGTAVSRAHDYTPVSDVVDDSTTVPHRLGEPTFGDPDARLYDAVKLTRACQNCQREVVPGVAILTCYRPAAANFLANHGINVYTDPMFWRFIEDSGVVRSTDPLRFEVVLGGDDATRTFVVDSDCQIIQNVPK